MNVTVLLFGHYRDYVPECPDGKMQLYLLPNATIADAAAALGRRDGRFADLLKRTRAALGAEFAETDSSLADGDEIAFLPPMSGG